MNAQFLLLEQSSNQNANISLKQEREFEYAQNTVRLKLFFEYALKANIPNPNQGKFLFMIIMAHD